MAPGSPPLVVRLVVRLMTPLMARLVVRMVCMLGVLSVVAVPGMATDTPALLPPSQHCGTVAIAGNWTRNDIRGFLPTRIEIAPLGGSRFAILPPQIGSRRPVPSDPTSGIATVFANGTMSVNCTSPRWCQTVWGSVRPRRTVTISTKYIVFGSWQKDGANCSKISMFNPPGSPGSDRPIVLCNHATDITCPPPP